MALLSAAFGRREPILHRAPIIWQPLLLIMEEKGHGHEDLEVVVGLVGGRVVTFL
jgi:hypothetical protein